MNPPHNRKSEDGNPPPTARALEFYPTNPTYGILGEAVETSASFEARTAPLPYPTPANAVAGRPVASLASRRATGEHRPPAA